MKAAAVLAEIAGVPFPRPFAAAVEVRRVQLAPGVAGDLYAAHPDAPILMFVPGATEKGTSDPRVIDAATSIAKTNRQVFVPELTLYERTFERSDIDRLATAIEHLGRDEPIGVLGFSYGGSFALIAAAAARTEGKLSYVATFGAYYDLLHVIQGITTGHTIVDGDEVAFETVPEARAILTSATIRLAPESYAGELRDALERGDPSELGRGARGVYDLLANQDPTRLRDLADALPVRFRNTLERFSPSNYLDRVDVAVLILQSKKDAATPWTEAELLAGNATSSRLMMLDRFSHVDPPGWAGWLTDAPKAWWFTAWVLEPQE